MNGPKYIVGVAKARRPMINNSVLYQNIRRDCKLTSYKIYDDGGEAPLVQIKIEVPGRDRRFIWVNRRKEKMIRTHTVSAPFSAGLRYRKVMPGKEVVFAPKIMRDI